MVNALVVSSSGEMLQNITLVVREYGIDDVTVSDGSGVRDLFETNTYSLVILNLPLKDEIGLDLVSYISKNSDAGIMVMVSQKSYDEVVRKLNFTGAYIIAKPVNKQIILQAINFMITTKTKEQELSTRVKELENKLQDAKLVDRAKCVLIQYLRISEKDAYRQIQKRAMDQRESLVTVAQDILRTYEM